MTPDLGFSALGVLCLFVAFCYMAAAILQDMRPFAWPRRLRARNGVEVEDFRRPRNYRRPAAGFLIVAVFFFALWFGLRISEL